ncbi:hypothetical protein CEXT_477011 [Caerostris extrusa]|uniref:Uncharacterized protein n=1 Tax=Caerostris extrusa TaxID=172846 RepID=A0AAV4XWD3_CAEEX|nr:hypothetical protein CEXT_477011 [Caerostris extrusa]
MVCLTIEPKKTNRMHLFDLETLPKASRVGLGQKMDEVEKRVQQQLTRFPPLATGLEEPAPSVTYHLDARFPKGCVTPLLYRAPLQRNECLPLGKLCQRSL